MMRSVARKGFNPMKFSFDITFHQAINFSKKVKGSVIQVEWKRGDKVQTTQSAKIKEQLQETAVWEQKLSMLCTIYKNPKTGQYAEKSAKFTIKMTKDGKVKSLGSVYFDLADFCGGNSPQPQPSMETRSFILLKGGSKKGKTFSKKDSNFTSKKDGISLKVTINSLWLKDFKGGDDGASVYSDMTGHTATSSAQSDDDSQDDLDEDIEEEEDEKDRKDQKGGKPAQLSTRSNSGKSGRDTDSLNSVREDDEEDEDASVEDDRSRYSRNIEDQDEDDQDDYDDRRRNGLAHQQIRNSRRKDEDEDDELDEDEDEDSERKGGPKTNISKKSNALDARLQARTNSVASAKSRSSKFADEDDDEDPDQRLQDHKDEDDEAEEQDVASRKRGNDRKGLMSSGRGAPASNPAGADAEDVKALREKVQRLTQDRDYLRQQLKEVKERYKKDLEEGIENAREDAKEEHQQEQNRLQGQIKELLKRLEDGKDEDSRGGRNGKKPSRTTSRKGDYSNGVDESLYEAQLEELQNQAEQYKNEISKLKATNKALGVEVDNMQESLNALKSGLAKAEKERDERDTQLRQIEQELISAKLAIANIETEKEEVWISRTTLSLVSFVSCFVDAQVNLICPM